jgi:N-methylhydantoinase A/oxoprolinase/acetone carboxylase beta subunit
LAAADASLSAEVTIANGRTRNLTLELEPEKVKATLSDAGSGTVERVAVRGVSPVPRLELEPSPGERYEAKPRESRSLLGEEAGIYDWNDLSPEAVIPGPAVLESETNTCTVPAGWELEMDGFANAVLRKEK